MTRQLGDGRQQCLNLEVSGERPRGLAALEAVRFQTPDPERLVVFGQPLRVHLEGCGQGWVVRAHEMLKAVDFSALVAGYKPGSGQPPLHPRLVMGLFVYGFSKGQTSLRELETLAKLDLGAMYLCGGLQPDHSTLGNFLVRHAAVVTEEFFVTLTKSLLGRLGTKPGPAAADGTVVEAAASRFRIAKAEALQAAAVQAAQDAAGAPAGAPEHARAQAAAALAQVAAQRQAARDANRNPGPACLATTEPDAVVQPRKDGVNRPSYKPVILANADRMITGQNLQPSNENAGLAPVLAQHTRILGALPTTLLVDAGFFVAAVLALCNQWGLDVLCPAGKERNQLAKQHRDAVPKERFSYDAEQDVYRCPQGQLLVLETTNDGVERYGRYRCHACDGCPRRAPCTQDAKGRTIKRYADDDLKEAAREVLRHPQARQAYRRRKVMVEPVFAELKQRQGLQRFRRRGRVKVAAEFAMHCLAYNLRRALRCLERAAAARPPRRRAVFRAWTRCARFLLALWAGRTDRRAPTAWDADTRATPAPMVGMGPLAEVCGA